MSYDTNPPIQLQRSSSAHLRSGSSRQFPHMLSPTPQSDDDRKSVLSEPTYTTPQLDFNDERIDEVMDIPLPPESEDEFQSPKNKRKRIEEPPRDRDQVNCPICLQPWSRTGRHVAAALRCGHIFGKSCVDKWVQENRNCPTCKMLCYRRDIRRLWISGTLNAMDIEEKEKMTKLIENEKYERNQLDARYTGLLLNFGLLKKEFYAQAELLRSMQRKQNAIAGSLLADPAAAASAIGDGILSPYVLLDSVLLENSRAFDYYDGVICASQCHTINSHGLVKMSLLSMSNHAIIPNLHKKQIKCVQFRKSSGESSVLTGSIDGTLNVVSMMNDSVVVTYDLGAPIWACAWDPLDDYVVYASGKNGDVAVLDLRNTSTPRSMLTSCTEVSPPVHSIVRMGVPNASVPWLMAASTLGASYWESESSTAGKVAWSEGKQCTSLAWESQSGLGLASLREGPAYVLFDKTTQVVRTLDEPLPATLMSRCAISTDDKRTVAAVADERSCTVKLWDAGNGHVLQSLPGIHTMPVLEIRGFMWRNAHCLASLSERQLMIHTCC